MNTIFSEKSLRNEIYLKQNSIRNKRSSQDLLIKNLKALLARMHGEKINVICIQYKMVEKQTKQENHQTFAPHQS